MKKTAAVMMSAAVIAGVMHSLPVWAEEATQEKDAIAIYFLYSENTEDKDNPDAVSSATPYTDLEIVRSIRSMKRGLPSERAGTACLMSRSWLRSVQNTGRPWLRSFSAGIYREIRS